MSGIASEANKKFDAPRPAVTSRLGKKRTDELIRADGDTWQEYLAVSEKIKPSGSNGTKRGGVLSSLFGKKKNKDKNSESNAANKKSNDVNSTLIIRSYFENLRTGQKVWDEPPSGASNIVPASEEMRRMAELQLNEIYVTTRPSTTRIQDLNESSRHSTNQQNGGDKKSLLGKGSKTTSANNGKRTSRRIRYKPGATATGSSHSSGQSLNDRQLQEAIERSMNETHSGVANGGSVETEEEILRRVLEESRLEAKSSHSTTKANRYYYEDQEQDHKPAARKHPPPNTSTRRR